MNERAQVVAYEVGSTQVTLSCPKGHRWTVDFSKGPIPKRIGSGGVAMLVRHWRASGVTDPCKKCKKL